MHPTVKQDILAALDGAIAAIDKHDADGLHHLSNTTIHCASIFQDGYSIEIAVVLYALSKMILRDGISFSTFKAQLERARSFLSADNYARYSATLQQLMDRIGAQERKDYVRHVINDARIKKGSRLYEHGISVAKTAEVLGISQWELMSYVGKTTATDDLPKANVKQRLHLARELFGVRP
ncbi:hypothetical protein HZB02_00160 [Candidatus Woesearchaeota archaeon]|nr:hypothetical protein [Candidatus Woesearchaeota archaeon]